jgi:hypothetical protein
VPRMTTNEERMVKARQLIEDARHLPAPTELGWQDFSYVARVKDILRQAHDQVKFIRFSPSASPALKAEAQTLLADIEQAEKKILHR